MKIVQAGKLSEDFFSTSKSTEADVAEVEASVRAIIADVRERGDAAVRAFTRRFDGIDCEIEAFGQQAFRAAYDEIPTETADALQTAAENLQAFAECQREQYQDFEIELQPGVRTGQRVAPIERVGVYAPGGAYPLASSLLMGTVPARVAGVDEVVVCSPPSAQGRVATALLVAADVAGVDAVYPIGGAQAIAALAYGTETVRAVDKIVGPGNPYVTQAKQQVFGHVGIDLVAGPTEVLIVADAAADPQLIAADLLAQAEHGIEAEPILTTPSKALARAVEQHIRVQLEQLETREVAGTAVERNGLIVRTDDLDEALAFVNRKAPEHLELQVEDPEALVPQLNNYGSLFIGERAAEVLGDYSSGLNHTLPTGGAARWRGGLGVGDFLKVRTTLRMTDEGLAAIGPTAERLASAEGLTGHRRAVAKRRGD